MELFVTSFEIENMVQTIKDVSEPLAAKNDNGFVINLDGAMGSMSQDETKLRQCLTNFLSNGFKFTKNGTVTLDVKARLEGDVEFVDFAVIDTGAGMSPEVLLRFLKSTLKLNAQHQQIMVVLGWGFQSQRNLQK